MSDFREAFDAAEGALRRETSDWEQRIEQQEAALAGKRERYAAEKAALQGEVADLRREVYALCSRHYEDSDLWF